MPTCETCARWERSNNWPHVGDCGLCLPRWLQYLIDTGCVSADRTTRADDTCSFHEETEG